MELLRQLVVLLDEFVDTQLGNSELKALLGLLRHALHALMQGQDALENQLNVVIRISERTWLLISSNFFNLTLMREPEIVATNFVHKIKAHL